MEQPQAYSEKQRAAFASLVEDDKARKAEELEPEDDVEDRTESEVLPKLAKKHGASALIAKVRKLTKKVEDAEEALGKLPPRLGRFGAPAG